MDANSPDLDTLDSASATSSTLVLTPHSGQNNAAKWHVDRVFNIGQSVHGAPDLKRAPPVPTLPNLRLLALRPNSNSNPNPMFQNQGKGPIQPHVNNLPRRSKPPQRKPVVNKRGGTQSSLSSEESNSKAEKHNRPSTPSSGDDDGITDSISVHSTHNSSPSRSPQQRLSRRSSIKSHDNAAPHLNNNRHDDGDAPVLLHNDNERSYLYDRIHGRLHLHLHERENDASPSELAATRHLLSLLNSSPSASTTLINPHHNGQTQGPKGHVQPHVSNIPRRRKGRGRNELVLDPHHHRHHQQQHSLAFQAHGNTNRSGMVLLHPSPSMTAEDKKAKRRRLWEAERCFQEILRGSGVWVGFERPVLARTGWVKVRERQVVLSDEDEDEEEGEIGRYENKGGKETGEEFVEGVSDRVVRICVLKAPNASCEAEEKESGVGTTRNDTTIKEEEEDQQRRLKEENNMTESVQNGHVLKLFVSPNHVQDDGVPHLSRNQVDAVRAFLDTSPSFSSTSTSISPPSSSSSSTSSPHSSGDSTSSSRPNSSPPTTVSSPSPSPSLNASNARTAPSSAYSSSRRRLCIIAPPECAVDAISLAVLAFHWSDSIYGTCRLSQAEALSPSHAEALQAIREISTLTSELPSASESGTKSETETETVEPTSEAEPKTESKLGTGTVLSFLARLCDVEDVQMAWRGLLSWEGIMWVADMIREEGQAMVEEEKDLE
ncbi:hypothetical protein K435DRAFT_30322 [Dendrothele bispora CBS 962.96]|uniref:Uncharacterized protein n=1 Tax=Dendrothele bispora (strain CBS 962.96) TaxID=1314807 RepID=A0A4S8M955_DENBC|nr:hypothetical protein K435DRAFT_30322 [Dendrothele bispora CBS 962.96]